MKKSPASNDAKKADLAASLPLRELRRDGVVLRAARVRDLGFEEIERLIQDPSTGFVSADVGLPLIWLAKSDEIRKWVRSELSARVVPPDVDSWRLEDFPGARCYRASLWEDDLGERIVVAERYH